MIKRRIVYLIILIVSFWIMLMYDGVFMEGIFLVVVFLPIICIILKYISVFSVYVNWTSDSINTMQGKPIKVMAVLCNYFFLPVSRVTIVFELEDILGNRENYKMVTNLMPHMERHCAMELCPNYSGPVLVRLKYIKINDILGLTGTSKKVGSVLRLMVYPKPGECIPVTVENDTVYNEESDEYSDLIAGNDKSRIFDISQYQIGDAMKDIHWKLSSKTDNLMVKRYSYPIEKQLNVFIDFGKPEDTRITIAGIGRFFDSVFDILAELEKNNESVCIYAFVGSEGECIRINKEDILYLDINNSCYPDMVCRTFAKSAGVGGNILISSRITKEELYEYNDLSAYYVNWNELNFQNENTDRELFIQDTGIIGIYMENLNEEKKPLVSNGDELYINKDNEEIELYTNFFRILLVLFGSIIPMLVFYDVLVVYKSVPIKVIVYPIAAVILMIIFQFIKNRVIKVLYMAASILGVVLLSGIDNIIDGTMKTIRAFGNVMMYSKIGYGLSMAYNNEIADFVAIVAFVYGVILFIFTWNSISVIIHMVLTIPPIALCLAYGCVPDNIYTIIYIAYLSGVFIYSITYKNIVRSEKKVLKKAFYESTMNIGAILSYTVMVIVVAIFIINTVKGYHRPEVLKSWKKEVNSYIDKFSLEREKIDNKIATGGLSNGRLGDVNKVSFLDEVMLKLNVSGELNFPLYLRGYIGCEYTGNSWETIDGVKHNEIENKLMEERLTLYNAYNLPFYIMDAENKHIAETGLGRVNGGKVTVENVSENDNTYYIPYGAFISTDIIVEKDGVILNNMYGPKSYNVYQLQGIDNLREYLHIDGGESTDYFIWESAYRNIAYEYYSHYDGDEDVEKRLRGEMPWEYVVDGITYNLNDGPENIGYTPYILAVRDYLSKNYKYSLSPGKLKDGQDFIERFMDDRTGYCSYFATIATEMFRIYGIPARYVEGYYVKPKPVELIGYYKNKTLTIDVRDNEAHAWTEIYVDGLGFIPVETTPGFAGMNYEYEEETSTEPVSGNEPVSSTAPREDPTTALQKETTLGETEITQSESHNKETEGVRMFDFMRNKYIVTIIIAAAIWGVILGRKSRYDRKYDEIVKKRRSGEALMWESQLEKMACIIRPVLNMPNDDTREELAERIVKYINGSEKHTKDISTKQVESMFLVFDKAVYSEEGADREEMNNAAATASDILEELYMNQSFVRRLFIKYIKCLYLK